MVSCITQELGENDPIGLGIVGDQYLKWPVIL